MKLMVGRTSRPLLASLVRGLVGLLFLLLVPLLYVVIFRARKKHAKTVGELLTRPKIQNSKNQPRTLSSAVIWYTK